MGCGNILNSVWCKFGKSAFMTALAVTYMHWYEVLLWFLKEVGYIGYRGGIALGLSTFLISNYLSLFAAVLPLLNRHLIRVVALVGYLVIANFLMPIEYHPRRWLYLVLGGMLFLQFSYDLSCFLSKQKKKMLLYGLIALFMIWSVYFIILILVNINNKLYLTIYGEIILIEFGKPLVVLLVGFIWQLLCEQTMKSQ